MAAPKYPQSDVVGSAVLSVANANRDGTGTLGTVVTGTAAGVNVQAIGIAATGNTTEGMIRFFLDDSSTKKFIGEIQVAARTPTAVQVTAVMGVFQVPLPYQKLRSANDFIKASTEKGETFHLVGGAVGF